MDKDPLPNTTESSGIRRFINRLSELFGLGPPDTAEDLEQEIHELLEEGEEHGLISSQEGRMINSIFDFRETMAYEIMTPRSEVVFAELSTPVPDLIRKIREEGFTRIPISSGNPDNIVGILHAKDMLVFADCPAEQPALVDLIKPAYLVPENRSILDLLRDFQARKIHMAVVIDEFGSVRGLVTLEDVLEEIVGEIDDEYDKPEKRWLLLGDGSLLVYAKIDIEEVEEFFKISFPEGPYESIGGLIIHQLGRVPENGEVVELRGLTFQVVAATKRHIKTLKIFRKGAEGKD